MPHVVLLGDSIFDNARYVPGGSPVVEQLRSRLPRGWQATLRAVDGAICRSIPRQLQQLPDDTTHLVMSVGGNDALGHSDIINGRGLSGSKLFDHLAGIQAEFRHDCRDALRAVLAAGRPTAVCTVYDAVPGLPAAAVTALSVFNDVILREAFRNHLPVLDLRLICDAARDYSTLSPIEPSEAGGMKIALAITGLATGHDFAVGQSVVYGQ
jgi:hypothetical protein